MSFRGVAPKRIRGYVWSILLLWAFWTLHTYTTSTYIAIGNSLLWMDVEYIYFSIEHNRTKQNKDAPAKERPFRNSIALVSTDWTCWGCTRKMSFKVRCPINVLSSLVHTWFLSTSLFVCCCCLSNSRPCMHTHAHSKWEGRSVYTKVLKEMRKGAF